MKVSTSEPGVIISGAVHAALLAVTLVAFSDSRKFEDATETVPVEVLSEQQFNQVMRGEKEAKPLEKPQVRADKQAEVEERKPPTPKEAKVDTPVPPPPLKRIPDPGEADKPEPPEPPRRVAALPPPEPPKPEPPKPEPPKPVARPVEPPKAEPPPEPPKREAEPIRPPEPKKAEVTPPTPPTPPKPPMRPRPAPNEAKPKPEDKPLDRAAIAKVLEKTEEAPKPASRPRSGDETSTTKPRLDANAISQLLSRDTPGARPSAAREPSRTASLGAPTATGQRLSPSVEGQIVGFITDQYIKCWSPPPGYETHYMPQIRIAFNGDGSLRSRPELMNRQADAKASAMGESALRAVLNPLCNPMRLPANLAPYFEQWIQSGPKILRFNPEDALG